MKSILTVATLALLAGAAMPTMATAQDADQRAICAANQDANAAIIASAKAAKDAAARRSIIQEALRKNPSNAICIIEMLIQLSGSDVEPAAGDEFGAPDDLGNTTNNGTGNNGENPNQLNEQPNGNPVSPAQPQQQ